MKKILFTFLFCLITVSCFAEDYWVYIRTYDKPELTVGAGGRSKKGDIVQVLPYKVATPSEVEQKEWLIIKVSDLTATQIQTAMQSWQEQTGTSPDGKPIYTTKAYRRYKISDLDKFKADNNISIKEGLVTTSISRTAITLTAKTTLDIAKYDNQAKWYVWQEKLEKFARKIIPFAYAANTTHTVITDGGGDYLTLSAYEDAIDGTSYSAGETATVNCSGTTADTTAVTFAGWDTDVTIIVVGNWDGSKWDTTKYRLDVTTLASQGGVIDIRESFVRIHHCQIRYSTDTGAFRFGICIRNNIGASNGRFYIYNNFITRDSALESGYCYGIIWDYSSGGADIAYIYNNFINNFCVGIDIYAEAATAYIENNTIGNCTIAPATGIINDGGTVTAINNLITGCTNCGSGAFTNSDYNATNLAALGYTGDGGHSHTSHTFTFTSTTETNTGFWHLASNDAGALDLGTSSVNSGYTTDIDGVTRTGTWDIGADEYVAGGGGGVIKTRNGLAWASVKTINGLAIGSVKTLNGAATQ